MKDRDPMLELKQIVKDYQAGDTAEGRVDPVPAA